MRTLLVLTCLLALAAAFPPAAHAYVGPGAGLTAIGALLAVLGALVLAVVGFVWYPVKKLMKRKKAPSPSANEAAPQE